jgi:hypothetical protein
MLSTFDLTGRFSSKIRECESFTFRCITTSEENARSLLLDTVKKIENECDGQTNKLINKLEKLYGKYDYNRNKEVLDKVKCELIYLEQNCLRKIGVTRHYDSWLFLFDLCPSSTSICDKEWENTTIEKLILNSPFDDISEYYGNEYVTDEVVVHFW